MEDLETAMNLSENFPQNVLIVKYEELVTKPDHAIPLILKVAPLFTESFLH